MKKILKKILSSEIYTKSISSFALRILGILIGYIFILYLSSLFGAKGVGMYSLSFIFVNIFALLGRVGVDTLLVRDISRYRSLNKIKEFNIKYKNIISLVFIAAVASTLLSLLCVPFIINNIYHQPDILSYAFLISCCIIPYTFSLVFVEMMRGLKKILIYSYFKNISFFVSLIIFLAIFNYFEFNYAGCILLTLAASSFFYFFASRLVFLRYMKFERTSKLTKGISKERMLGIVKESTPLLLASSMMLMINWIDSLAIGYFGNETDVGVYTVLTKISNFISIILISVDSIAAPKFSELFYKGEIQQLKNNVRKSTSLIFITSFPMFLIIAVFREQILGLIGKEYIIGASALLFLLIGQLINALSGCVGSVLLVTGHQRTNQYIIFSALITQIILNCILVPLYGIKGAAISSMISTSLWNLLGVYYVNKKLNIFTFYVPKFISRE